MTDYRGNSRGAGVTGAGPETSFEPFFKMWSQWLRIGMGPMKTIPGASLPWLTKPGISTGEEVKPLPEGAMANDPLLSALSKIQEANPLANIVPLDWLEITRALQTLWMREVSNLVRAMQVATAYNQRLFETTMNVWSEAAARFWGMQWPQKQEEKDEFDPRFSSEVWESNPYYKMLKDVYLLASEYLMKEAEETDGRVDPEKQRHLEFHLRQFVEAMAPVNFLFTNPDALERAFETGGASLVEGTRNLLSDIAEGSLSQVDSEAFEVGENLATTPGKVVYRNRLMELIQYEPTTEQVYEVPLLFIPPWINKYYILDLREKNSLIKYLVEQGFQVFMISWKNPDESMADTTFEDYMTLGPLKAAEVAREITGAGSVNPVGYCIGGTLLGTTLAYLTAGGDEELEQFGSPTFLTAMLDFSDVAEQAVFTDEPRVEFVEMQMKELGYLPGEQLDNMFNLLEPTQLIWSNVVNNYLLGHKPPAFDMLYWNSDSTRQARDVHSWYLRNTYLENNLIKPGKVEFGGRPIDLGKIEGDIYAVGTREDHISPWKSAWATCKLTNGNIRYALADGGHVAGVVSPPEKGRGYWVSDNCGQYDTADEWFENVGEEQEGSWWEDWTRWLRQHCGEQVEPPRVGSGKYPPIENAPGIYVKET